MVYNSNISKRNGGKKQMSSKNIKLIRFTSNEGYNTLQNEACLKNLKACGCNTIKEFNLKVNKWVLNNDTLRLLKKLKLLNTIIIGQYYVLYIKNKPCNKEEALLQHLTANKPNKYLSDSFTVAKLVSNIIKPKWQGMCLNYWLDRKKADDLKPQNQNFSYNVLTYISCCHNEVINKLGYEKQKSDVQIRKDYL